METKRKQFSHELKTQVVLAAIREEGTLSELAGKFGVHPIQISKWRKEFLKDAPHIFSKGKSRQLEDKDKLIEDLYRKVGKAEMEADWLKKRLDIAPNKRARSSLLQFITLIPFKLCPKEGDHHNIL